MIGWMLLLDANLIANEPTAELAPYTMNGIDFWAGTQGKGRRLCAYNDTEAVKAARGSVAASAQLVMVSCGVAKLWFIKRTFKRCVFW